MNIFVFNLLIKRDLVKSSETLPTLSVLTKSVPNIIPLLIFWSLSLLEKTSGGRSIIRLCLLSLTQKIYSFLYLRYLLCKCQLTFYYFCRKLFVLIYSLDSDDLESSKYIFLFVPFSRTFQKKSKNKLSYTEIIKILLTAILDFLVKF